MYTNYKREVYEVLNDAILESIKERIDKFEDFDEFMEFWQDYIFSSNLFGNQSGSFTYSRYAAEQNLVGNWELMLEVFDEWEIDPGQALKKGAEYIDVVIRLACASDMVCDIVEQHHADFDAAKAGRG